jgi:general secretion pathway protein D
MFVLPTHRMRPSELADVLDKIAIGSAPKGDKGEAARPTLLPVDGARVILFAGSEIMFSRIEALLARIDPPLLPGEERGGRIAVFYLKHTTAEDLAATVKEVLTGAKAPSTGPAGSAAKPAGLPFAGAPIAGAPVQGALEGEVRVTADKVGNSLVVSGSAADIEAVRELVARLDLPQRQVYVEAVILDLSADLSRAVGLSLHQGAATQSGSVGGFAASTSSNGLNGVVLDPAKLAATLSGGGLLAGVLGKSFSVAGMSVPSFGVVLQALETSSNTNVLSRPHLLTLDHTKATISVGQKIPFPIGNITTSVGSVQNSFSREPVQIKLDLTPHLSDESEIRLEIEGTIDDVAASGDTASGGPITNNRAIKTTVVVHDGETVVLGGLQKESAIDTLEKVPLIGDVPVLGMLFRTHTKKRTKQDLLIVLTPYVIRDEGDLRRIAEQREDERRELEQRATMFDDPSADGIHIDYARKRGLLAEINAAVLGSETESDALAKARAALSPRQEIRGGEVTPVMPAPVPIAP